MWKQVSGSAFCGIFCQKVHLFFAQMQDEKKGWNGPAIFFFYHLVYKMLLAGCITIPLGTGTWLWHVQIGSTLAARSSRDLPAFSTLIMRLGLLPLLHDGESRMVYPFDNGTGHLPGQLTRGLWKQKNKEVGDNIRRERRCPSTLALRKYSQPDCCFSDQRHSHVFLKWHRVITLQTFNLASSKKEIVNQAMIIYSMI